MGYKMAKRGSVASRTEWQAGEDWHEQPLDRGWEVHDPWSETRLDIVGFGAVPATRGDLLLRTDVEVYARFADLRDQWVLETQFLSSIHDMVMHPAYQQIIGLGPQVVPFMIDELRVGPQHWNWALAAIVGEDPALGAETMRAASSAWVEWFDRRR
jgi:hypothetical protein